MLNSSISWRRDKEENITTSTENEKVEFMACSHTQFHAITLRPYLSTAAFIHMVMYVYLFCIFKYAQYL